MSTKTETKHTPGPWKVVKPLHGHATQYRCAQIGRDKDYTTLELKPEDARLIAAAPELLEACKAVMRLDYLHEHNALAKQVEAAIRKAQGDL